MSNEDLSRRKGKKKRRLERDRDSLNAAFENQVKDNYWYPSYFKYIAWGICIAIVMICSVLLTLYAIGFGEVKSLLWLSTVFSSILISTFFVQPIKVLLLTLLASYVLKRPEPVMHKPLPEKMSENPYDRKKFNQVMRLRRRMAPFYLPLDVFSARRRKIEIRYLNEVKGLVGDMISYLMFMTTIYVVVYGSRSKMAIYSNQTIRSLVVDSHYTNTLPFSRIVTHEQFIVYLNESLIPSLLGSPIPEDAYSNSTIGTYRLPMPDRAYTMEPCIKLLGRPRLRQKRVIPASCELHYAVENSRSKECSSELAFGLEDTTDYSVAWQRLRLAKSQTAYSTPWQYRSAKHNRAASYSGNIHKVFSTDGGGYILPLGKTVQNSRTILDFMYFFNWVDSRTRSVYIEFASYTAGANLYNSVILNVEITAIGAYIPGYKVSLLIILVGLHWLVRIKETRD